jgi:dTDP-4-amino-4,6-dideoxygalactose transaminase
MLRLGVTEFDPDFPMRSMSGFTAALLEQLLGGLDHLNHVRSENARRILLALPESSGFRSPKPTAGAFPIYLRLPLLASDNALRDRALANLRAAGIGASSYYPGAICDIPGIESFLASPGVHFPRAEGVARRILTLPTHPLVEPGDLQRMVKLLVASSRESSSLPVCPEARARTALAGRE